MAQPLPRHFKLLGLAAVVTAASAIGVIGIMSLTAAGFDWAALTTISTQRTSGGSSFRRSTIPSGSSFSA